MAQARSDWAVLKRLSGKVETCHTLHYLQMATEKLAKALLTSPCGADPAPPTHVIFVRMLQVLKARPEIRVRLGYGDAAQAFRKYIDSLLDYAGRIERLAPDQAGFDHPNPEYPWLDKPKRQVLAPCEYSFDQFYPRDKKTITKMAKIDMLVGELLKLSV